MRPTDDVPGKRGRMLEGLRILLVDDSDDERTMYQLTLEAFGASVRAERTATDALEALLAGSFDILVSDIALPGMSGYDLIREVRTLVPDRAGGIPAIAVTGYSRHTDQLDALEAGFDRYCSKPCGPADLAQAILELVKGRAGSGSAQA